MSETACSYDERPSTAKAGSMIYVPSIELSDYGTELVASEVRLEELGRKDRLVDSKGIISLHPPNGIL